jgi:hypothetical protein
MSTADASEAPPAAIVAAVAAPVAVADDAGEFSFYVPLHFT